MTRIVGVPRGAGPLTRVSLRVARRKTARLAGRETERMIEPLEAFAHAPRLMTGYGIFELQCARVNRVEHHLKELAVLKAAAIVNCEYCIDIGSSIARKSGLSDEQLLALAHYRTSELFDETEKLVLDLAVAMSRAPVEVPDELFEALRARLDDGQLVELTNIIALENFRARFNAALEIGSAGFAEGMVCAVAETDRELDASSSPPAGAEPARTTA
jgi:AhpD family alkylhydroperoxidase